MNISHMSRSPTLPEGIGDTSGYINVLLENWIEDVEEPQNITQEQIEAMRKEITAVLEEHASVFSNSSLEVIV